VALTNHRNDGEGDNEVFGVETCDSHDKEDDFTRTLGNRFNYYGSDKATFHDYYKFYGSILQQMGTEKPLNILEIGMGTNNPTLVSSMGTGGSPGASLRVWRDSLPNANIYGADIDRDILFTRRRIQTAFVDQLNYTTFEELHLTFKSPEYDLIIDDGLHSIAANLNTFLFGLRHIKKGGYVVIEDIGDGVHANNWKVVNDILSKDKRWDPHFIMCSNGYGMFVVNRVH